MGQVRYNTLETFATQTETSSWQQTKGGRGTGDNVTMMNVGIFQAFQLLR